MSWAADAPGAPIAGAWRAGQVLGIGVKGSEIPATGESGPSYLYEHATLPADNGVEFRGEFLTIPSGPGITFNADEYGRIDFVAPDGSYTATYNLYRDGVLDGGSPYSIFLNIGQAGTVIQATDSGIGDEGFITAPTVSITIVDTGAGAEAADLSGELKNIADAGSGGELITQIAANLVADNAAGADQAFVTVDLQLADAGLGFESSQVGGFLKSALDAGAALEALGVTVSIEVNDAGTATELAIFGDRLLQMLDAGAGVDIAYRQGGNENKDVGRVEVRLMTNVVRAVLRTKKTEGVDYES